MKKKKKIPKRMLAIAAMVDRTGTVADVGCDHAYISINLLETGKADRIIASDLREGPLRIAGENIKQAGFEDRVELRLCAGLSGYKPGEADTILISGMGGILTGEILSEGREVTEKAEVLILEPQSDLRLVRMNLKETGFIITDEDMLEEGGKYYQIIKAKRQEVCAGNSDISNESEAEFGPILIKKKHPVLKEFLIKRKNHFETLLKDEKFMNSKSSLENNRAEAVKSELKLVLEALERFMATEEKVNEDKS